MSLLLPNQHQALLSLGAEHLALIWRTGYTKKVLMKHHETYQPIVEQPWKVALQQLDRQLKTLNLPHKTHLSVTLASDLVRYIVLPAHQIAMSASEKLGYAQAAYREIYGAAADNWKISIDDTPPAQPTLACAIDASLYEALDQLTQKYQLRISTVQPYLMTTFNKLFSSIKSASASLIVIEQTRMLTLLLQNGVCQQVRSEKFISDWQTILEQTLSRDQLLTNNVSKELMIYAPTLNSIKLAFSKNFTIKRLSIKTKNFVIQPDYAMLEALV